MYVFEREIVVGIEFQNPQSRFQIGDHAFAVLARILADQFFRVIV